MPLSGDYSGNWRLIGSSQSSPDHLDERSISLKPQLTSLGFERRLVSNERKLVLDERAERFGYEVEFPGKLLIGPAQSVESDAEPFVELGGAAPLQPCAKGVGEDGRLR